MYILLFDKIFFLLFVEWSVFSVIFTSMMLILQKIIVRFHKVDDKNLYFLDLFEPDNIDNVCRICNVKFDTFRKKKNHMFLYHYSQKQSGGRLQKARDLPLNILKRGAIIYYSVNFDQHKDFL